MSKDKQIPDIEDDESRDKNILWQTKKDSTTGKILTIPRCKLCNKDFVTKQAIYYHIDAKHLKLKPFQCDQCGYTCTRDFALKLHVMRAHSNAKPYTCDVCQEAFRRKRELNAHLRDAHSEMQSTCHLCDQVFKNRLSLHLHLRKIHGAHFDQQQQPLEQAPPPEQMQQQQMQHGYPNLPLPLSLSNHPSAAASPHL